MKRDLFVRWFDDLAAIGRLPGGAGWRRFAWTPEDRKARLWFRRVAELLDLEVECDVNGNLWAWWGRTSPDAVPDGAIVTGSHLDTVAGGGAYDGALGLVSGFAAVDELRRRHGSSRPPHPMAVVAFAD